MSNAHGLLTPGLATRGSVSPEKVGNTIQDVGGRFLVPRPGSLGSALVGRNQTKLRSFDTSSRGSGPKRES